jgi:hypothetical protein
MGKSGAVLAIFGLWAAAAGLVAGFHRSRAKGAALITGITGHTTSWTVSERRPDDAVIQAFIDHEIAYLDLDRSCGQNKGRSRMLSGRS